MKQILEDMFDLPRTFLAWIVYHLASWLDMRVIPNDDGEEIFDDIFEEIEDVDMKDIDED